MSRLEYPNWKKLLWEFGRTFVAVLLIEVALTIPLLEDPTDFSKWWTIVLAPALAASLRTLGEYLRKVKANGNYSSYWYKLPV